ncbi:hypothetical protein VTN49DRAFT_1038 [Thermomyces lanuginosus]|uniref:uncharacterized protein n=1 Tax=Thermomyces lanuginosus TaxID=5541 RepID=UPI003742BCED
MPTRVRKSEWMQIGAVSSRNRGVLSEPRKLCWRPNGQLKLQAGNPLKITSHRIHERQQILANNTTCRHKGDTYQIRPNNITLKWTQRDADTGRRLYSMDRSPPGSAP